MPYCVFDRSNSLFVRGAQASPPAFNSASEILLVLAEYPDRRTVRWNGTTGIRAATAAEIAAYDDADKTTTATTSVDTAVLKAVVRAILDEIDARFPSDLVDRPAFRARAISYLKGLL